MPTQTGRFLHSLSVVAFFLSAADGVSYTAPSRAPSCATDGPFARRGHARSALIDAFLAEIQVLYWGHRAADRYGTLAADLRRKGLPIGCMDTKIAAHALAEGLILVTNNTDDFGRVQGLRMENWVEEPA
jgi:tRNA(fMet)-specific endonuclease VapC